MEGTLPSVREGEVMRAQCLCGVVMREVQPLRDVGRLYSVTKDEAYLLGLIGSGRYIREGFYFRETGSLIPR